MLKVVVIVFPDILRMVISWLLLNEIAQKYVSLETTIYVNVYISTEVFIFHFFLNSCDIRISTFIACNLIKI